MGQNIGLLSPKVASLLRWVLDLLERVVEKGQVQPIIGNLLILRGINRLLLSPFHFSSLGVKKWNPIQTKNAVRLSKLNMKMAQKKERKEDASVSWVSFLVSGDDEEEEEEEEEGEPLFALFLKKIPKREVLNRKIKEQDEVMGRLSGEQKNNVVTASLMVFRDFLSRFLFCFVLFCFVLFSSFRTFFLIISSLNIFFFFFSSTIDTSSFYGPTPHYPP